MQQINSRAEKCLSSLLSLLFALIVPVLTDLQAQTTVLWVEGPCSGAWTAPASGGPHQIRITALGGAGGNSTSGTPRFGGSGATMAGEFTVPNSAVLRFIAGGRGGTNTLLPVAVAPAW